MKTYDGLSSGERVHTIRVTFQSDEYKGHIAYEMGGNCAGLDVMDWDPDCTDQDDIDLYVENDCNFRLDEDMDYFLFELHDEAGNACEFECDGDDLKECVVAVEIIACRPE